jgi:two-component system response regulator FixJ
MVGRIHVIDPDIRRRAQVHRELSNRDAPVEIYEDLEEFCRSRPNDGFVFAFHDGESSHPSDVVEAMRANGCLLPIVMYAEQPATESVVSALRSGALDYLEWPFIPGRLGSAFRRLESDGDRLRKTEQLRDAARAGIGRLSNREREVLVWIIQGLSNKEIARVLHISPRTVEIHRGKMMAKLHAQSTADAVRIALYAGLDEAFRFAA